ncbi:hypothetical protein A3K86_12165 [Photobacterium jeanii]|uniref:Uncharacterized protein n=2 Tax=Photobacterium jeanii TaxID=858640 RepID=A0A178KCA8_9GAMM|nr:hypothetical protein A3K86_12165 [Photobacterium jeanii]PST89946.1 hypothetical protein C9I91_12785 [Photobacterium jeanii]
MMALGCGLIAPCNAQVYPSTGTAWVLPGHWEAPLTTAALDTAEDVKQWEAQHADLVFGSMRDPSINRQMITIGYMYSQKLDCKPSKPSAWLSAAAKEAGVEFEDLYLHFANDTLLAAPKLSQGVDYLLQGQPLHQILLRDGNYATARYPLMIQPDDELILISSYPFDTLNIQAGVAPQVMQGIPAYRFSSPITETQANAVTSVKQNSGLKRSSGLARWQSVHADWQQQQGYWQGKLELNHPWRSSHASIDGRAINTGLASLQQGLQVWMVKLSWKVATKLDSVGFQPWLKQQQGALMIPGWDSANDINQDGYVSDSEFSTRKNQTASARFRHQARLIPAGHMWPGTCWYRVNFGNPKLNALHADWYAYDWQQQGLTGAYNDDMAKLLGNNQFVVNQGGLISELNTVAGGSEISRHYAEQMAAFLALVKQKTQTRWLAANISELNLWHYQGWPASLRHVMDVWLREHYLTPAMGLNRLYRYWDNFALAQQKDKSLIMASMKGGRSQRVPLLPAAWHQDITTGLALYYLFNLPQQTYYHSWNSSFYYGSGNTDEANWYRQGVPKNWAYQPSEMLAVDIGEPVPPPKGYRVVYWRDEFAGKTHTVKTTSSQFNGIAVTPANWFWLYRSGWGSNFPRHGVIARQYSQGLVLYRAMDEANNVSFTQTDPLRVSLPGDYQRVLADGTLGEAVRYIELSGYEGVVLKKAE